MNKHLAIRTVYATIAAGLMTLGLAACSSNSSSSPSATATDVTSVATSTGETPSPSSTSDKTTATATGETTAIAWDANVPAPPAYDDSGSPVRMLTSYINAINRHEYERAYGHWHDPSQTLADFEQGYTTTANVAATLEPASGIDAATSQRRMLVAVVLDAMHTDGSTARFSGCYVAWKTVEGVSDNPDDTLWHIDDATITSANAAAPLATLLADGCTAYKDRVSAYGAAYQDQTSAIDVVVSMYDAINRGDLQTAYGYWRAAPLSLSEFEEGYADTASAIVTTGTPVDKGAAAGSVYERVPVVVTGTLKDGSVQRVSGCYTARRSNMPEDGASDPSTNPWSIDSGTLTAAPEGARAASLLAGGCAKT